MYGRLIFFSMLILASPLWGEKFDLIGDLSQWSENLLKNSMHGLLILAQYILGLLLLFFLILGFLSIIFSDVPGEVFKDMRNSVAKLGVAVVVFWLFIKTVLYFI